MATIWGWIRVAAAEHDDAASIAWLASYFAYNIAQGSIATYYPEANVLVALDDYDVKSGAPSYKSTSVVIRAS